MLTAHTIGRTALLVKAASRRLLPVIGLVAMLLLCVAAWVGVHERTDAVFDRAGTATAH